ncbi:MAG: helix-turn-helix transcriptional regulator [Candidatus Thermoplasmatota archaeon]|nr:helix-turn-helix transcriptional regulator [Candidatus Thermoplasmatota archaeon]
MAWRGKSASAKPIIPEIPFESCPIRASLGVLGRKWACLVLRDVAFFGEMTFTRILRNNPGMTPRILSIRLRDLKEEGVIERIEDPSNPRNVTYRLTRKGEDAIPILTSLIQYGMLYHANRVFGDGKSRQLGEVFPGKQRTMLGSLGPYAKEGYQTLESETS